MPPIALQLTVLGSIALCVGLKVRSQTQFDYWVSPVAVPEHERLILATGYGDLYLAYGWPSTGPSENGLPVAGPIFGSEAYEGEPVELEPGEASSLATQQFLIKVDGVATSQGFPFLRLDLAVLLLPALAAVTVWLDSRIRHRKPPEPRPHPRVPSSP